jgi:hypothetical protein
MTRPATTPARNWRRVYPIALLSLIILFCAGLKIRHNDRPFFTGVDGGLYTDIAEHIRDGDGIVTDVSPYHHGYPAFPHLTAIYPLWPLVYGHLGRYMPMRTAGVWAPTLGYFVALFFAYLWAAPWGWPGRGRSAERGSGPADHAAAPDDVRASRPGNGVRGIASRAISGVNPGHALVLFLGLNGKFFAYTSLPYTEGLGYALLFACLWRFRRIGGSASLGHAVEMGIWLAALMLVRSHFLVVALAAFLALAWGAWSSKEKRGWLRLTLAIAVFVAAMVPWYVHIATFIPEGRLTAMFRYDQARVNDLLSPFRAVVPSDGVGAFLRDRLAGLGIAFSPSSASSYISNFHGLPYAFLLFFIWAIAGRLSRLRPRSPQDKGKGQKGWDFERAFVILFSAGSFASLQLMHMDVAQPWLFSHRHALLMIVPFFLAWLLLAGSRRLLWTTAAAVIGVYTVGASYWDCRNASVEDELAAERTKPVARWLAERAPGVRPLVIVAKGLLPQLLAPQVRGVGFHGVYDGTTERDYRVLVEQLGASLIILEDRDIGRSPLFQGVDPGWFPGHFERSAKLPGYVIFTRKDVPESEDDPEFAFRGWDP